MISKYFHKLDNAAKFFSLDSTSSTNFFRYTAILVDDVEFELLCDAINYSLKIFPQFKVKLKSGMFWDAFTYNNKECIVTLSTESSNYFINLRNNNDYLFKVTYLRNKINIDFFHVLTDGCGAMMFLEHLLCRYLSLKYNVVYDENKYNNYGINDEYLNKYNKKSKVIKNRSNVSFQFDDMMNKNVNNTYHYIVDIVKLKKVCKCYKVSITEFLTSLYIYAIYLYVYKKNLNKEIVIAVPINLRSYYKCDTLSNFFVCMNVNPKIIRKNISSFKEILNEVHNEFVNKLDFDNIESYLTKDVRLGNNLFIEGVPLFLKKFFIKYVISIVSKTSTSTLSNVGCFTVEDKFKKYIDNVFVLASPSKEQKIRCSVCSYDNKLNIVLNSNIDDMKFQNIFLDLLKKEIGFVKIQ